MDRAIYEFFDKWAAYFQTKRGWNLLRVRVWVAFILLITALATSNMNPQPHLRAPFMLMTGFIFGIILLGRTLLFKRYGDYPENIRKCEELNSFALEAREAPAVRLIFVPMLLSMTVGELIFCALKMEISAYEVLRTIWHISFVCEMYMACCFYLGPGQHSRELNKQISGKTATERSQ